MTVPSIGRIVHYRSHGTPVQPDGSQVFSSVCRAAVITDTPFEFATDGKLGLCVLNPDGLFFQRGIPMDAAISPGTWHWPEIVE